METNLKSRPRIAAVPAITHAFRRFRMKPLWTILAFSSLSALAWAQPDDGAAMAAIEKMYARLDAAMARQDAGEIGRLILPDAFLGAGDVHFSLLAWITGAMKQPGRTSRSTSSSLDIRASIRSSSTVVVAMRRHVLN